MVIIDYSQPTIPDNFTGVLYIDLLKTFKKNKLSHRYYGPACLTKNNKQWWFNGKFYGRSIDKYNQKQFIKNLNKLWLL